MDANEKDEAAGGIGRVPVLASLVTLINAICGFASIHFVARGINTPDELLLHKPQLTFFAAAGYLLFLAMIADALDGQVARLSRTTSNFGEQLDSLADMISFGVAPAILMLGVVESSLREVVGVANPAFATTTGKLLWLLAAAYVCCAALRLARFNVETQADISYHVNFRGLPSPAAAGVVAALVVLCVDWLPELHREMPRAGVIVGIKVILYLLPFVTLGVALLMVSRIPYSHLVNRYVRGRRPFGHVVRLVLVLLVLYWNPQLAVTIGFTTYAASGFLIWGWRKYVKKSHHAEAVGAELVEEGEHPVD